MGTYSRRSERSVNTWPGFVDAMATLLMVIIFLLMIFVIAQFFLNDAISGRDDALNTLESQVSELADMLALERKTTTGLRLNVEQLSQELQSSVTTQDDLRTTVRALTTRAESAEDKSRSLTSRLEVAREKDLLQLEQISSLADDVNALTALRDQLKEEVVGLLQRAEAAETESAALTDTVAEQKSALAISEDTINRQIEKLAQLTYDVRSLQALKTELETEITQLAGRVEETEGRLLSEHELSESARAEVALLNQQMAALRSQLSQISALLDASEVESVEQKAEIQSLGKRLNAALASKVQELSRYRSEFFGRLSEILGQTEGIHIVGDRFVLQSELLFDQGSADLGEAGQEQMLGLATTLKELAGQIPDDIDWILRVDGHTDAVPIRTARFPSNWELSAARAISVVKFLTAQGLPPTRLAATGFGEYQPIDTGQSVDAMRRNRRIELKLTQR